MKEVLDAYAALKWQHDESLKIIAKLDADFKKLMGVLKGKIKPVDNGRIVDYAIEYIQRLESKVKEETDKPREEVVAALNGESK